MKAIVPLLLVAALCSCQKESSIAPPKNLSLSGFQSMLSKEHTFAVTAYFNSQSTLDIPAVNAEDTYTFDGGISDGWVSSKQPCIEYHYNFKTFSSGNDILLEWVDFNISPTTFVVEDYEPGNYFTLRSGDVHTRYEITTMDNR